MMRLEQAVSTRSQMLKPVWKCIKIQFFKKFKEKSHFTDVSWKDPNFSLKIQSPKKLCWCIYSVLLKTALRKYIEIYVVMLSHRII